ncbi:hypothetical protein H6F88_22960 [Oculatella sp. FACHB-28]|uniref:hypothetical protein n=1 Tax=Oculatella sp. FACHB-28 TaxID=2692845 RepID=UPI0016881B11|nr:hypothetical protein [Oculatella sp. FACHB-28]MBD2058826.1 hypothetical protein [Oculatella sp. FACHB-28]
MEAKPTDSSVLEKRIRLPEPDMSNITVLTRQLPNEPILPWHRYDSPWLNPESESLDASEAEADQAANQTEDDSASMELEEHQAVESEGDAVLPDSSLTDTASPTDTAQAESVS